MNKPTGSKSEAQLSILYRQTGHTKTNTLISIQNSPHTCGFKRTIYGSTWMEKKLFYSSVFQFSAVQFCWNSNKLLCVAHIHMLVKADTHTSKCAQRTRICRYMCWPTSMTHVYLVSGFPHVSRIVALLNAHFSVKTHRQTTHLRTHSGMWWQALRQNKKKSSVHLSICGFQFQWFPKFKFQGVLQILFHFPSLSSSFSCSLSPHGLTVSFHAVISLSQWCHITFSLQKLSFFISPTPLLLCLSLPSPLPLTLLSLFPSF